MFGEKDMLGCNEGKITNKARIILPDFCHAEENDMLVILGLSDYLEIWEENTFREYLKTFKKNDFSYSDDITSFILKTDVRVDVTRRINLSVSLLKKYFSNPNIVIEGKGKYIRVWSTEKFFEYRNNLEKDFNLSVLTRKKGVN